MLLEVHNNWLLCSFDVTDITTSGIQGSCSVSQQCHQWCHTVSRCFQNWVSLLQVAGQLPSAVTLPIFPTAFYWRAPGYSGCTEQPLTLPLILPTCHCHLHPALSHTTLGHCTVSAQPFHVLLFAGLPWSLRLYSAKSPDMRHIIRYNVMRPGMSHWLPTNDLWYLCPFRDIAIFYWCSFGIVP